MQGQSSPQRQLTIFPHVASHLLFVANQVKSSMNFCSAFAMSLMPFPYLFFAPFPPNQANGLGERGNLSQ